jgi:hypothetical protein
MSNHKKICRYPAGSEMTLGGNWPCSQSVEWADICLPSHLVGMPVTERSWEVMFAVRRHATIYGEFGSLPALDYLPLANHGRHFQRMRAQGLLVGSRS